MREVRPDTNGEKGGLLKGSQCTQFMINKVCAAKSHLFLLVLLNEKLTLPLSTRENLCGKTVEPDEMGCGHD